MRGRALDMGNDPSADFDQEAHCPINYMFAWLLIFFSPLLSYEIPTSATGNGVAFVIMIHLYVHMSTFPEPMRSFIGPTIPTGCP